MTTDPITLARDLLRCPSVTPAEGGALALIERVLQDAGFTVHRVTFEEPGTDPIDLYPPGEGKPIPGQAEWLKFRMIFPKDSVLVKTIGFGWPGPGPARMIETQLLHFDGHDWRRCGCGPSPPSPTQEAMVSGR